MTFHSSPARLGLAVLCAAMMSTACSTSSGSPTTSANASSAMLAHEHAQGPTKLTAEQRSAVAGVRQATAGFHRLDEAKAAGYTLQFPAGCSASSEGAQGVHFLNEQLAKDDVVDPLRPELVMYEPQRDGSYQLVGVDYVVPFTQRPADGPAPTLLGVPFGRNDALGVWALHIWAWRPNPSGMFSMWNPKVSCALAQ